MAARALADKLARTAGRALAIALLAMLASASAAPAEADKFQQAVNYVLTGRIDPRPAPEIVDREACVVVMRDPKFNRYIRYHLERFNIEDALFEKKYSGPRVSYQLNVKGDDVLLEYLSADMKAVTAAYRSAQIPLPGEIELTRKALDIIFKEHCKPEAPKSPF